MAMWYRNAVIYSLDVETFMDANGDGVGDFRGLIDRIDHFETVGASCVWLQPFHPSPNRDDGYDVTDYYGVDARLGTLGEFAEFAHELGERGIRLILDLVVNHTSDRHPWFQAARRDRGSPFRDFYIWSEEKPVDAHEGVAFPGVQDTTWTWDEAAGAYYFHRFFPHQPDLNIANPAVRAEILRIVGFWLRLGVSGFRIDAAPFLIEHVGAGRPEREPMYAFLEQLRDFVSWRSGDAILLAEANVAREDLDDYFARGERVHLLFSFLANQAMFLAFARQDARPLRRSLQELLTAPHHSWAQFLRTHDELDLGRLSAAERQEVFAAFGPEPGMQLYERGIRRRLAAMFGNDRRRLEMAHSLICSLPGPQVIRYGDEIGMGDDLDLPERNAVRTPMQWSDAPNAGFSRAAPGNLIRPVIANGAFGFPHVNVQAALRDRDSLLNRVSRLIRIRRSCPEIGNGETRVLDSGRDCVLAHVAQDRDRAVLVLHNFSEAPCRVRPQLEGGWRMIDIIGDRPYDAPGGELELSPFGYRWIRLSPARGEKGNGSEGMQ